MEDLRTKFEEHIKDHDKFQNELLKRLDAMQDTLNPISTTYSTASKLGQWIMGGAVFVSICIGVIIGLKELLHK